MPQCSSTCCSSNELALNTDIQTAFHVQHIDLEVALGHIKASRAAIKKLLGPTLQAELHALKIALECYHRACEALQMLAVATSR